jgi:hypothetical protein
MSLGLLPQSKRRESTDAAKVPAEPAVLAG